MDDHGRLETIQSGNRAGKRDGRLDKVLVKGGEEERSDTMNKKVALIAGLLGAALLIGVVYAYPGRDLNSRNAGTFSYQNGGGPSWCGQGGQYGQGGCGFVDNDKDGVCDNYQSGNQCTGFVDKNGDGICDCKGAGDTVQERGRCRGRP